MVLQNDAENFIGGVRNRRGSLKENGNKKDIYTQNSKETAEVSWIHNDGGGLLENLTLTGHMKGQRDKKKKKNKLCLVFYVVLDELFSLKCKLEIK